MFRSAALFCLCLFIALQARTQTVADSTGVRKDSLAARTLAAVTVNSRKPFMQQRAGKVIINPDAMISNSGTTVLEVLEKSPGVIVDRNGGISLRAKPNVMVMIDDKPSYLSGQQLADFLSGISSSQVDVIELITNPSAKYDAAGNAGIINIKLKKNKQQGFNGTVSSAFSQGQYYKNNNSLSLNYRSGKLNGFINYSINPNKNYMYIYADRNYFGAAASRLVYTNTQTPTSLSNNLKTGADYFINDKTTVGIVFTGTLLRRNVRSNAHTDWLNRNGDIDSALATDGATRLRFKNAAININLRHKINANNDIGFDADRVVYDTRNTQLFENRLLFPGTYRDGSRGDLPSDLNISAAKADHTLKLKKGKLESGFKTSRIQTDNIADYEAFDGSSWTIDLNKSNHFLYTENINAVYSSIEQKFSKTALQLGLRYEHTSNNGRQLGNAQKPDSSFTNRYSGIFPTAFFSWEADSANTFSFSTGRRLDRPSFNKLNPFVFIINKYTYQTGNPYIRPQYTWNTEISHSYKQLLTTTASLSITRNYFSQIFLNEGNDLIIYTEGNVGRAYNFGLSVAVQASPVKWWTLSGQALFNYKKLKGFMGSDYSTSVSQLNLNINNQFKLSQSVTAEISGFYTTRARADIAELLYPTGQLTIGLAKQVLKGKGNLRLAMRDIFHTQTIEGLTDFPAANEYFILYRDTRVVNIGFTYRFGKAFKLLKKSAGSAGEEMQRAG